MFRFPQSTVSSTANPGRTRHLLRRAVLFGTGLLLLWAALQLAPQRSSASPTGPPIASEEPDDGVAAYSLPSSPRLVTGGNIAVVFLLAGGVGLAVYLRRRTREQGGMPLSLHTIGQMSLAPNQQLRLIRCGEDVLLLGVTANQITLLKEYAGEDFKPDEAFRPVSAASSGVTPEPLRNTVSPSSFARLLREQVGLSTPAQTAQHHDA